MDWLIQGIIVTFLSSLIASIINAAYYWIKKENNLNIFLNFYLPLIGYTLSIIVMTFCILKFNIYILILSSFGLITNLILLVSSFNSKN